MAKRELAGVKIVAESREVHPRRLMIVDEIPGSWSDTMRCFARKVKNISEIGRIIPRRHQENRREEKTSEEDGEVWNDSGAGCAG